MSLLDELNEQQKQAAQVIEGPVLIIAGAGSGKTMALTYRVAHMIHDRHISPDSIIAVTFTNKAADEMKRRIRRLTGDTQGKLWVGTFHATCARILRADGAAIGIPSNFVIFDQDDQRSLIKRALSALDIDAKDNPPRDIHYAISNAKNELLGPAEYRRNSKGPFDRIVGRVYSRYQTMLRNNNALDFDDLLMQTVVLLRTASEVRDKYQDRFKYILVDEFQDINHAQFEFVRILAEKHGNICVVGDDDQSIYGWRGADVDLILRFSDFYPDARVCMLEQNYRSTQKILECAYEVIKENADRHEKKLWTRNRPGDNIVQYEAVDAEEEAEWVAQSIRTQVNCNLAEYGDFAILYRTNALSRAFEEELMKLGIPYEVVGGIRFYERAVIKDIIAYLRVLLNPADAVSLSRIINRPTRGIGEKTLGHLQRLASSRDISLYEATELAAAEDHDDLGSRGRRCVQDFVDIMQRLREKAEDLSITKLCQQILEDTGYLRKLEESGTAEDDNNIENLQEFVSVARRFEDKNRDATLTDFLEHIALVSDIDEAEEIDSRVSLMTLHSAKGLEFPVVYMVAMEEGLFPHERSMDEDHELAEERRLCYVGITRAEHMLYMTHAYMRTIHGQTDQRRPSRFLKDLPEEFVDRQADLTSRMSFSVMGDDDQDTPEGRKIDLTGMLSRAKRNSETAAGRRKQEAASQQERKPNAARKSARRKRNRSRRDRTSPDDQTEQNQPVAADYNCGDHIKHATFGEGVVVQVMHNGDEVQLRVAFDNKGVKDLLVDHAPIEKV